MCKKPVPNMREAFSFSPPQLLPNYPDHHHYRRKSRSNEEPVNRLSCSSTNPISPSKRRLLASVSPPSPPHTRNPPPSLLWILLVLLVLAVPPASSNLCTLCQSLREHVPYEFHSCVFKDHVVRHCKEGPGNGASSSTGGSSSSPNAGGGGSIGGLPGSPDTTTLFSNLKIVGVKRVIRVNYDSSTSSSSSGGDPQPGNSDSSNESGVFWEIGLSVVMDKETDNEHAHHSNSSSPPGASSSQPPPQQIPSQQAQQQVAIVRFSRYPSSLLLQNPCRHVLGTINYNNMYNKRNKVQAQVPSNQVVHMHQRSMYLLSSSGYFVIEDKMCRETAHHRGVTVLRKKCIPLAHASTNSHHHHHGSWSNSSSLTHPYECCTVSECSTSSSSSGRQPGSTSGNSHNNPDSHHHNSPPQSPADQDYLRPLSLSTQCICICFTLILSCIVFWIRKSKVIQVSVWPLTESIILGSTLLYTAVAIRACYRFDVVVDHEDSGPTEYWWWWYDHSTPNSNTQSSSSSPSSSSSYHSNPRDNQSRYWACVAEPWARELGFTLVYGGIVLKIYRSLVEFRTRKAHRWVVREKDILRYLGTTVAVVLFYLLAWTCTVRDFGGGQEPYSPGNNIVCPAVTNWHRVTEIGELLYISVGLNMAWHLRTSPVSPFLERQMYTGALVLEATASVLLIILRECKLMFFSAEMMEQQQPDPSTSTNGSSTNNNGNLVADDDSNSSFLLLLYVIRCHVTTTVILGLVLGPKLYFVYVDASSRKRAGALRRGDTLTTTTGTMGSSTGGGGGSGGGSGTGLGATPTSASLSNLTTLKLPPSSGSGGGSAASAAASHLHHHHHHIHGLVGVDHHTALIDLDFAEVSLAEMDPQDIKMELKRVYTQLELLRNKTMRKDNPHISKRRGGRKPTHRRFSLQKKGSRDKTAAAAAAMRSRLQAQQAQSQAQGGSDSFGNNRFGGSSRYNDDIEDSVCSIEGPSTYSEVYR